jgi:hypothetical protein
VKRSGLSALRIRAQALPDYTEWWLLPKPEHHVLKRAHELFGRGGKLFITWAEDGSGRSLRTTVQADGDIVTRATEDSLVDPELSARHVAMICAWFKEVAEDWAALERDLTVLSGVGTVGLVLLDFAKLWDGLLLQVLVPLAVGVGTRVAVGWAFRYAVLRARNRLLEQG